MESTDTLPSTYDDVVSNHPDETALWFDGTEWAFSTLRDRSLQLANGLVNAGHNPGEASAIWLPNRPEWFVAHIAFSRIAAPVTPVNTRYKHSELEYIVEDGDVRTLVLQPELLTRDFLDILLSAYPGLESMDPEDLAADTSTPLDRVVVVDEEEADNLPTAATSYSDLLSDSTTDPDGSLSADDPCTIFYTSGTTSKPKGAVHNHESVTQHPRRVADWFDVTAEDTSLVIMPLCGVGGFDAGWSSLLSGAQTILLPHFDGDAAAQIVEKFDVTYLIAIGAMWSAMLDTGRDLSSLERGSVTVFSGSARPVVERISEDCRFPVVQPYGLSEAHSHVVVGRPDDPLEQRAEVGGQSIHPDIEVAIRDPETGEDVDPGETGEICLRGYSVLSEYLGKPEKTAAKLEDDGWFHTDDLGRRDEDGYVYYLGRMEDTLRLRGFRVSPFDIEADINSHPAVDLAQVVGADRNGEEVPVAFVRANEQVAADDIRAYLDERMADYKIPVAIEIVDSFPITEGPNGEKIQRNVLVERAADLI